MKTAVIYARYSSDSQSEQSIEGQLRVCRQYAEKNDLIIVDEYIDRAMTGTNDNRIAFQKMLKDSSKKQFSVVLVYKLDRFSRNKYESVIHKKTLKDNGIRLVSCMENIPDTPEGTLMEALLEGFNQYFSEELTQKVNRGLRESWLKGNATGGGHVFGYDIKDKKYVINEKEALIVKDIFTKYSQNFRAKTIAKSLNERGVRRTNGQEFNERYIFYLLHNSRYTGKVEHQGTIYDNIFPQIIDEILWEKIKTIHKENKVAPSRKKEKFGYILSGKLVCGDCKQKMYGESGTSKTKDTHYYYVCSSSRKKKTHCHKIRYKKDELEDFVIEITMKLLKQNANIEKIAEIIFDLHKKETQDNTTLNLLEKKKQECVKASKNIISAIEQGIITDLTKSRLQELENEILELDFEISKEKQRCYTFLSLETIKSYLKSFVFENTDNLNIRKLIVNIFIKEIILYENEIIITYNFIEPIEPIKINKENIEKTEKQIDSALSFSLSSCLCICSAP